MPSIITNKFRMHNAKQFHEAVSESSPSNLYVFIARTNAWPNDSVPPLPVDEVKTTNYDIWRNMIGAKKISSSDASFAIPRHNWTQNTVYTNYRDDDAGLYDKTFFVVTDDFNVYKCIDNNGGARSTVKPTSTGTTLEVTSDGYKWKFMYSISAGDALKFLTRNYAPAKTLTSDDGSSQYAVQTAATNGAIEAIFTTDGGSSYSQATGTLQQISNTTVMRLASSASGSDDFYVGSTIYISGGVGAGQIADIVDYNGTTKDVTISSAFSVTPNSSSTYLVGPKVTIGGDGRNASAYARVSGGSVSEIIMINGGSDYSYAPITISANSGSGAIATAPVSPQGGHGSDPVGELAARNVVMNVKLTGDESDKFIVGNDFRIIGIMADPLESDGVAATNSTYDLTTKLTLTGISSSYQNDEIVSGGSSSSLGRVVAFANTNATGTAGVLSLTGVTGTFRANETLTGNTSSASATISSIDGRDLRSYTGDVIFIENRSPVTRAGDQTEDIKIIIRF